jgi:hypothetical protein
LKKKEYIERGAILRKSETMFDGQKYCTAVNTGLIYTAPAADVVEVVHGEWIKTSEFMPIYGCSICKERNLFKNGQNVFFKLLSLLRREDGWRET